MHHHTLFAPCCVQIHSSHNTPTGRSMILSSTEGHTTSLDAVSQENTFRPHVMLFSFSSFSCAWLELVFFSSAWLSLFRCSKDVVRGQINIYFMCCFREQQAAIFWRPVDAARRMRFDGRGVWPNRPKDDTVKKKFRVNWPSNEAVWGWVQRQEKVEAHFFLSPLPFCPVHPCLSFWRKPTVDKPASC